jgi:predicted membrane metal-binding protein
LFVFVCLFLFVCFCLFVFVCLFLFVCLFVCLLVCLFVCFCLFYSDLSLILTPSENEIIPEMGMHSNVTSKDDADRGIRRAGYKYSGDKGLYVGPWLNGKPHGLGTPTRESARVRECVTFGFAL